jgi:antitoxin YefM
MPVQTTYTQARTNFGKLYDEVIANRDIVIINRRGHEDVALIAASELSSLIETADLFRSPKNAERLLTALHRSEARTVEPQTLEEFRREVGLDQEE